MIFYRWRPNQCLWNQMQLQMNMSAKFTWFVCFFLSLSFFLSIFFFFFAMPLFISSDFFLYHSSLIFALHSFLSLIRLHACFFFLHLPTTGCEVQCTDYSLSFSSYLWCFFFSPILSWTNFAFVRKGENQISASCRDKSTHKSILLFSHLLFFLFCLAL